MNLKRDHWLCLVAASLLARTSFGERTPIRLVDVPELTAPSGPGQRVEVVVDVGDIRVALEHTQIESYPNQIGEGFHLDGFADLVREHLPGELPPGYLKFTMATDALNGVTTTQRNELANECAQWIHQASLEMASELTDGDDPSPHRRMTEPLEAILWFREADHPHGLLFSRFVPDELEAQRVEKLVAVFESKLPKLGAHAAAGTATCLVLEDADLALANTSLIVEAGAKALARFEGLEPTWIVVTEVLTTTTFWSVLLADGEWCDPGTWQNARMPLPELRPLELGDLVEV